MAALPLCYPGYAEIKVPQRNTFCPEDVQDIESFIKKINFSILSSSGSAIKGYSAASGETIQIKKSAYGLQISVSSKKDGMLLDHLGHDTDKNIRKLRRAYNDLKSNLVLV